MSTFTIEECKRKIEKLMALSTSSNEHEAALALEKAQQMLNEHNLSIAEITTQTTSDVKDEIIGESLEDWELMLASELAKIFDVSMFTNILRFRFQGRNCKNRRIKLYGLPLDIEAVKVCFGTLRDAIERLSKIEFAKMRSLGLIGRGRGETLANKLGWFMGCIERITSRVKALRAHQLAASQTCTALMIRKEEIIKEAINARGVKVGKAKESSAKASIDGFELGLRAGERIAIQPLVKG